MDCKILGEYKLVPLLPKYFEQCLQLMALQFSKDNSILSPVNIGLNLSQKHFIQSQRLFFKQLINSPICCLMINPNNDDVMAVATGITYYGKKSKHCDITSIVSPEKHLMDNFVLSKVTNGKYIKLYQHIENIADASQLNLNVGNNNNKKKICCDSHVCINPKYTVNNSKNTYNNYNSSQHKGSQLAPIISKYFVYLRQINNYEYGIGIAANEYSIKTFKYSYKDALIITCKAKYSDIFDYLNKKLNTNRFSIDNIPKLKNAMKKHPYRYGCIVHLENKQFKQRIDQFVNIPKHKNKLKIFIN